MLTDPEAELREWWERKVHGERAVRKGDKGLTHMCEALETKVFTGVKHVHCWLDAHAERGFLVSLVLTPPGGNARTAGFRPCKQRQAVLESRRPEL